MSREGSEALARERASDPVRAEMRRTDARLKKFGAKPRLVQTLSEMTTVRAETGLSPSLDIAFPRARTEEQWPGQGSGPWRMRS